MMVVFDVGVADQPSAAYFLQEWFSLASPFQRKYSPMEAGIGGFSTLARVIIPRARSGLSSCWDKSAVSTHGAGLGRFLTSKDGNELQKIQLACISE